MKNVLIVVLVLFPSMLCAGSVDNKVALADLSSVKIISDVNIDYLR